MTAAVDTNILLDLLIPGAPRAGASEQLLVEAAQEEGLVICEVVYAELSAAFPERGQLDAFLDDTGIVLGMSTREALNLAGQAWREYSTERPPGLRCPECGTDNNAMSCEGCGALLRSRQHLHADFVIGAHALVQAGSLLTRDRGHYATYFPRLRLR